MLNLIVAEAALELVPSEISGHPSVRNEGRRRGIEPDAMLLDRSIHHAAMLNLRDHFKRGRPDLVHLTLLNITSTPFYQEGRIRVYIHTYDNTILEFQEGTRPPKSYSRFRDLMQKVLKERPNEGLIKVFESTVRQLLKIIGSDLAVGLSIQGERVGYEELASALLQAKNPVAVIGGFPRGHFSPETTIALDRILRIDDRSLDAHVVIARVIYEVERLAKARNSSLSPRS